MDQIELHFLHSLLAYFCYILGLAHISTLSRFCDRLIWRFPSSYLMCKSWIYIEAMCSRISPVSTWRTYIQCFVKKKSDKSTIICCYNIKTELSKSTWQFSKSNDSPRIKSVFSNSSFVFLYFITRQLQQQAHLWFWQWLNGWLSSSFDSFRGPLV